MTRKHDGVARSAPAPFAIALACGGASGVHAEFDGDGSLDTGSITFGREVNLRAAQGSLRLLVGRLPDTVAMSLAGRHVTAVLDHPWLRDPRLVIERVDDEEDRLSLVLPPSVTALSE